MSPERWNSIKRIFNEVADLAPAARRAALDARCDDAEVRHEVERMLAADAEPLLTESPLVTQSPLVTLIEDEAAAFKGRRIGPYRILDEIGRGGMGTVFAAVRDDGEFDQKVAIKIIKRGLNTQAIVRRFRHERQILASLDHPNIARLIDGGVSADGLPYYVMELIAGHPIDEYCRARQSSVAARLELFRQVAAAVAYAHRRLIVHRDLKPSNILVTDGGQVKLLDFGIAKVLSQTEDGARHTATQLGLMTPDYASPEQFRGETVTTATDVYSLGVVLYELLAGALPYELKGLRLDEMLRLVCETEVALPANAPQLRGDLGNVVLKAIKKEPERRYDSVEQFSEDVRRYLEGLPVAARPDTFAYRASTFVRRNKVSVLAAVLVFVALVTGILATTFQARAARRERARAEKRFDQVRKLANNVVFKYHDAIAALPGATETREMLVKDAIEYLDNLAEDAADNPTLAEELALAYLKIGNVQGESYRANLGDSAGALASYRKSLGILETLVRQHPTSAGYLKNLHEASQSAAFLLVRLQRWQEAEVMGQRLLEISQRLTEMEPDNLSFQNLLARSYLIKGDTMVFSGGDAETIRWYRLSLEEAERAVEKNPASEIARRMLAVALQRLGTQLEYYAETLKEKGEAQAVAPLYAEAEQLHRRSVEASEALERDFPQSEVYSRFVAATSVNLGTAMARVGRGAEGVAYILRSLATERRMADADPKNNEAKRDIAELWQYMAFARRAMNQHDEAIKANQSALGILEEITASDPSNFEFLRQTHLIYNAAGDIRLEQGRLTEALAYYHKGMAYAERMAALNDSSQIAVLRSESNRKIGEAYLAIAARRQGKDASPKASKGASEDASEDASLAARAHLVKAHDELLALRQRGELGKNYEHRIALIERALNEAISNGRDRAASTR